MRTICLVMLVLSMVAAVICLIYGERMSANTYLLFAIFFRVIPPNKNEGGEW